MGVEPYATLPFLFNTEILVYSRSLQLYYLICPYRIIFYGIFFFNVWRGYHRYRVLSGRSAEVFVIVFLTLLRTFRQVSVSATACSMIYCRFHLLSRCRSHLRHLAFFSLFPPMLSVDGFHSSGELARSCRHDLHRSRSPSGCLRRHFRRSRTITDWSGYLIRSR